jgi:hypothetical protein
MGLSKDERKQGYRMAPLPSAYMTAILRRVAGGSVNVTMTQDGPEYHYDDGALIREEKGRPLSQRTFNTMVREGWLLPVEGGSFLKDGPPQQYRARKASDPALPRVLKRA